MPDQIKRVALLVVPLSGYYTDVVAGIQEFSLPRGDWLVEVCSADPCAVGELLETWQPDAVIFDSDLFRNWLPSLEDRGVIRVQVGGQAIEDVARVSTDNLAIGRLAAEHFIDLGFRNFGYCGYRSTDWSLERRDGFVRGIADKGMRYEEFLDDSAWRRIDAPGDDLSAWLGSLPKPVGVFACHDRKAALLARACQLAGLVVPDEVAILGVDDDPLYCLRSDPPLSSIMGAVRRIGYEAGLIIDGMLRGDSAPGASLLIPPAGVSVRISTNVLAIDEPHLAAAIEYINEHVETALTVDDVAGAASTSRRRLERLFREQLHSSPGRRIVQARIERAKQLLMETDRPVLVVALDSGFSSASKLSTVFRRHVGLAPIEFRRRYRIDRA